MFVYLNPYRIMHVLASLLAIAQTKVLGMLLEKTAIFSFSDILFLKRKYHSCIQFLKRNGTQLCFFSFWVEMLSCKEFLRNKKKS